MIKFFHKLTKGEFEVLITKKLTWEEVAKDYPQPKWCGYPDAVSGVMGCWSLMAFRVKGKAYCKCCYYFINKPESVKS